MREIDYQIRAVDEVIDHLDDAWENYFSSVDRVRAGQRTKPRNQAVYLSALTGAGKTIMVGKVIAQILGTTSDSAVLWLSDNPSLNEQTMQKLKDAELVDQSRMRVIDKVGVNDRLEPGNLYFLNRQKLDTRRTGGKGERDTLARWTFLADAMRGGLRLYVVQDEAHRGISKSSAEEDSRDAVITSVVEASHPNLEHVDPIPVVLGLSATPKNFKEVMASHDRDVRGHEVDSTLIQASGLVKRDIDFKIPTTGEQSDPVSEAVLLDIAVATLKQYTDDWGRFHEQESAKPGYTEDRVVPLLLFQMPNGIDKPERRDEFGEWLLRLEKSWTKHFGHGLPRHAIAHVFERHSTMTIGEFEVPYCPPQDVQERTEVRVLLAKMAVTTGWDCPRAEVLYSLRGANDETYIAQLLGRMVRMPLAERSLSPELDRLNVARAILPHFTAATVDRVVTGVREGFIPSETKIDMVDVVDNPALVETHGYEPFDIVRSLTKKPSPSITSNPIRLMDKLGVMVTHDQILGIAPGAGRAASKRLAVALDGYAASHPVDVEKARVSLGKRYVDRRRRNWISGVLTGHETQTVDLDAVQRKENIAEIAGRMTGQFGDSYVKHLRGQGMTPAQAREQTAALALLDPARELLERTAREQCREWLGHVEEALRVDATKPEKNRMLEKRRNEYRQRIREFGDPLPAKVEEIGPRKVSFGPKDEPFEHSWENHLLVPEDGKLFALDVSDTSWEKKVLDLELGKDGVIAWYRNPGSGREFNLQVPWKEEGSDVWRSHQPDFIFVEQTDEGLRASVVDPHDPDRDGLERLRGAARFLKEYGDEYARWWAVGNRASGSSSLRYIDLLDEASQDAVLADGADAHVLFATQGIGHSYHL